MKKFLVAAVALLLVFSASGQVKWGVTGGVNFNTSKFSEIDVDSRVGWNAGVTCLVDLPLGFSVQPSLLYAQRGANITDGVSQDMGFVEFPVSVQWGPDLLLLRPFIDVTPYIGYAVSNNFKMALPAVDVTSSSWKNKERFEYGLGVGGGLNIWKIQILARYCWNFGTLYNVEGWNDIKENLTGLDVKNSNFGGVTLSVAFLF